MPRSKAIGRVKAPEDKLSPAGRPRKTPPKDAAEVIRSACATGATKIGVGMALGVSYDVLNRWLDEDPELKEAFTQGRETERKTLHNVLYNAATQGTGKESLIAAMFLLKARHGYQEGQQESQANRVSINFQIPGALPMTQFEVIDHEPNHRAEPVSTKFVSRA